LTVLDKFSPVKRRTTRTEYYSWRTGRALFNDPDMKGRFVIDNCRGIFTPLIYQGNSAKVFSEGAEI
jgi:hypothetical protein